MREMVRQQPHADGRDATHTSNLGLETRDRAVQPLELALPRLNITEGRGAFGGHRDVECFELAPKFFPLSPKRLVQF